MGKKKIKTICKYLSLSFGESNNYDKSLSEMYFYIKNGREQDQTIATNSKITTSSGLMSRVSGLVSRAGTGALKPSHKYDKLDTCDEGNITSTDAKSKKLKGQSRTRSLCYSVYVFLYWIVLLFWPFPIFFWIRSRPDLLGRLHGMKTKQIKHSENRKSSNRPVIEKSVQKVEKASSITKESIQKDEESKPQRCPGGSNSVKNCCCPQACTDAILDQYINRRMTCRTRINYLMGRHGAPERDSCVATAENYSICSACNPDKCPVPI